MTFARPLLLLALLALPLAVAAYFLLERRRARYAVAFTNLDVLASVASSGRPWRRLVPPLLALVALALLCAGLARPHTRTLVADERATIVLVLDVSASMEAEDVEPTRLAAAQAAIRAFLDRVPEQIRVGLVAFAGDPQVASPPTRDREFLLGSLDRVAQFPGFSGTAIGDALALAVEVGQQATGESGGTGDDDPDGETIAWRSAAPAPETEGSLVSILFLSDGAQTRGFLQPWEGAQQAREAGIPVYTVSLGTPEGIVTREFDGIVRTIPVPPDPVTLSEIAETTGGRFYEAETAGTLEDVYRRLGSSLGRTPGEAEATAWFLGGAGAALFAALLAGALWSPRLP